MNPKIKQIIITILIVGGIIALYQYGYPGAPNIENVSISQIKNMVASGEIKELSVDKSKVVATDNQDKKFSAFLESGAKLSDYEITADKVKIEVIDPEKGSFLPTFLTVILPFLLVAGFLYFMLKGAQGANMRAMNFGKSRAQLYEGKNRITFSDVAGAQESKQELQEVVEFLRYPQKFLRLGAEIPKGVLLVGPPGTGKTLIARAVAGEAGVPFFSVSASEFVEMFVGVGAARTRDIFQKAKKNAPAILFIDELDAIGRQRGSGLGGSHDEREQTLNQILVEMDGFEVDSKVVVVAASVTGDTAILIRDPRQGVKLISIGEFVDDYYRTGEEGIEKSISGIEVLGFEKKTSRNRLLKNNLYFGKSAFMPVKSVFRHKVNEIYEIEYLGGKIRTTGNHSLFVKTSDGIIKKKYVCKMNPRDVLVGFPNKEGKKRKGFRRIKSCEFNSEFNLELPLWQPLFVKSEPIKNIYQYVLAQTNTISQTKLGEEVGFSQRTIGKWQQGICEPRVLSRNYYQHKDVLPERVKVTPNLMRLFGYYVAEGYSRKELDFCLGSHEIEIIKDIKILMKEIFGLEPDKIYHRETAINIIYYSKPLAEFFAYHCGQGAHNKHLPAFLFEAPKEYFVDFLKGYANGDGCFVKKGKNKGNLVLISVSKQLLLELNWLSRMHGFEPSFSEFEAREGRRIKNGKPLKKSKAYRLEFWKTTNPFNNLDRQWSLHPLALVKKVTKLPFNGFVYDLCGCENEAFFAGEKPILASNTNRPDVLDPALLRPGRFDRRVILDLPDKKEREEILKIHYQKKPMAKKIDTGKIAAGTAGMSGADLKNMVNEAAIFAARNNKKEISQSDLHWAVEKVLLGPERKSRVLSKHEKEIIAYHEAGHAIVGHILPGTDPVHKISIISRGLTLGYTWSLPGEDIHLYSKEKFEDQISQMLGGRVAEELIFKSVTTGASNDLKQATKIARDMVTRYGMSDKLGPMTLGEREELIFLGKELAEHKTYSEKIAAKIDDEISKIICEAEKKTKIILQKHRHKLNKIAKILLIKETIEGEEFKALFGARQMNVKIQIVPPKAIATGQANVK
ncbi:MAG: cell division protease FtsH [Candidatus Berkelbacteria bacterium Licking1014_7]|uniref:Cell division protease FtsH n=1 Tax=Candidatus Berkelbacteria bacterium Licking1014_7 TaxID=2017147 RepID=A0A554LJD9_9BACT|nr:MAG: cell division protease FtsH [Candidatus Berkelbacteria bacterium Licking1014_7]